MLDWKILAASFAALLFVSSMFVGDFAITDFFKTITEKIGEWLGNSPFGGMVTAPTTTVVEGDVINLDLYTNMHTLVPDHPVNITFDENTMTDFSGEITVDYNERKIIFDESNSKLILTSPLDNTIISGLRIKKIIVDNEKIDVNTGEWELSTNNGSIEIYDFSGTAEITSEMIKFDGNMSRLVRL